MTASTRRTRHAIREREVIQPMHLTPAHRHVVRHVADAFVAGVVVAAALLVIVMLWRWAFSILPMGGIS